MSSHGRHRSSSFVTVLFASLPVLLLGHSIYAAKLSCMLEALDSPLLIETDEGQEGLLADFDFKVSPLISDVTVCARWIEDLSLDPQYWAKLNQIKFQPLFGKRSVQRFGKLTGTAKSWFYEKCAQSPSCKLSGPARFDPLSWKLKQKTKQTLFSGSRSYCNAPVQNRKYKARSIDSILKTTVEDLNIDRIWFTPVTTFGDEAARMILASEKGDFILGTMSVSATELQKINTALEKRPESRLFLLFDLNAALASSLPADGLLQNWNRLFLVPVFNRPDFNGLYHAKGMAEVGTGSRVILTSTNLSSHAQSLTLDLGISGESPSLASSLAAIYLKTLEGLCYSSEYLGCALSARFSPEHNAQFQLSKMFYESCHAYFSSSLPFVLSKLSKGPARVFSTDEVAYLPVLEALVSKAKTRIDGAFHQFDHAQVNSLFDTAKKQKKDVRIFVSLESSRKLSDSTIRRPEDLPLEPHNKVVIVDRETVLWSTGNMTVNGLEDSHELFLLSKAPHVVNAFQKYINTVAYFFTGPSDKASSIQTQAPLAKMILWDLEGPGAAKKTLGGDPVVIHPRADRSDFFQLPQSKALCAVPTEELLFYPRATFESCAH